MSDGLSDMFGSIVLGKASTPGLDAPRDPAPPPPPEEPAKKASTYDQITTRLRSFTPVDPSAAQSRGRGMSLTCAAGDMVNEFKEVEFGGGNWGAMIKMFDQYCERLMGPPIDAHKDSITKNAIFKRTILLSDWIYSANKSHTCDAFRQQKQKKQQQQAHQQQHRQQQEEEKRSIEKSKVTPGEGDLFRVLGGDPSSCSTVMSDATLIARDPESPSTSSTMTSMTSTTTSTTTRTPSEPTYPLNEDLECVLCKVVGGKQIAQFALFVPKIDDGPSDKEMGSSLSSSSSSSSNDDDSSSSSKPKHAFLVFKGTDPGKIFDLIADICAIPFPLASGIGLHCGMYASMKRDFTHIRATIAQFRDRIDVLYVTGHSLGGGLASCFVFECLLHSLLDVDMALITYGAPTVVSLDLDAWFGDHHDHNPSTLSIPTPATVAEGLKLIPSEFERLRVCIARYIRISHHIVNRLDLVPRVPSSSVWVGGTIPFCVQKLLTSMICSNFGFNSIKPVRLAMGQAVRAANAHTAMYGDLLRTYWPLGNYYIFTSDGRYYFSNVPEVIENVYKFTPPIKVTLTYKLPPPSTRDRRASRAGMSFSSSEMSSLVESMQDDEAVGYSDDSDDLIEFEDVTYKDIMEDHIDTVTGIAQEHMDKALGMAQQGFFTLKNRVTAAISGQSVDPFMPNDDAAGHGGSDQVRPVSRETPKGPPSSTTDTTTAAERSATDSAAVGTIGDESSMSLTPSASASTSRLSAKKRIHMKKKKRRDEPRKCTVKLMMKCMDRRLQLYGTEEEKKSFIEYDEKVHEKYVSEMNELSSEARKETELAERENYKKRSKKLSVINGERSLMMTEETPFGPSSLSIKQRNVTNIIPFNTQDFVIVGTSKEKKKSGCSNISFDTQAWTTLGNCHKTGSYLKLFGLSSESVTEQGTINKAIVSMLRTSEQDEKKIQSSRNVLHKEKESVPKKKKKESLKKQDDKSDGSYELPKSMEEVGERVKLRTQQATSILHSGFGKLFGK